MFLPNSASRSRFVAQKRDRYRKAAVPNEFRRPILNILLGLQTGRMRFFFNRRKRIANLPI